MNALRSRLAALCLSTIVIFTVMPLSGCLTQSKAEEELPMTEESMEPELPAPTAEQTPLPKAAETQMVITEEWFDDAIFIGDSITGSLNIFNLTEHGLGDALIAYKDGYSCHSAIEDGDRISFMGKGVFIEDAVEMSGAEKVFLLYATNDLSCPIEEMEDCWNELVRRIAEKCPEVDIYIQSGIPMYKEKLYFTNDNIEKYNEMLQRVCDDNGCTYVDVSNGYVDDSGALIKEYYVDDVHLSIAGSRVWVENLKNIDSYDPKPTE